MVESKWKEAIDETVQNLVTLIQFDTSNPPGNELPAILAIKEILENDGIPSDEIKILEPSTNRANLVVRLKGDGSLRPLLLSGHIDAVPVQRENWSRDPFGGEIADGCIWGRGALDMKGFLAMYLETFLMVWRSKLPLKRDLILAVVADEEALYTMGSKFLVEQYRDLIDAEYGFTERGAMTVQIGNNRLYPIQVAEKGTLSIIMRTRGQPGQGAIPQSDNAILHLGEAIYKLKKIGWLPVHITATYRKMIEAVAEQIGLPLSLVTRLLSTTWGASIALEFASDSFKDFFVGILTNTFTPTILGAGNFENIIPSEAEVLLSCRILPGQMMEDLYQEIKAITGDQVEFEPIASTFGTEFSTDTDMFRRLVKATKRMDPNGIVTPGMMVAGTDANEYQWAGITFYGFTPGILPTDFPVAKLVHGDDERLPLSFIESGLPILWEVVTDSCMETPEIPLPLIRH
jgi:acetylornithine deacetylase/succinyl-diaminopimelate desuccinylase-like protein